jgi:hypothetical protein
MQSFLDTWQDWINNHRQELFDLIDGLLANVDDAPLGSEIQTFLGGLAHPDWQDHWDALDGAPNWMKKAILQTARDAADEGLNLYIDMGVDHGDAQYGVEVTTGIDSEGSWRAINMVHPPAAAI